MICKDDIKKLHSSTSKIVLTMGVFDGVHRGHRHLAQASVKLAQKLKHMSCVMSFYPHPTQVLTPTSSVPSLFTPQDQAEQFSQLNVDYLVQQYFSPEIAHLSAENFIKEYLLPLPLSGIVVGYDFKFGAGRLGDLKMLQQFFPHLPIISVEAFDLDGEIVSSSQIRKFLQESYIQKANKSLGRPYYLSGTIVRGDGRGQKIGFPTANLQADVGCLLKNGVYASVFEFENKKYPSVTNVGYHPTFENPLLLKKIETHVLDQNFDLYDKRAKVYFLDFIRDEVKFSGIETLVSQIKKDVEKSKEIHENWSHIL